MPPTALEALRYACCVHVLPARAKMYTAPEDCAELSAWLPLTPVALLSSAFALTAIVLPSSLIDREKPNWSPSPKASPSPASPVLDALTYACCVQRPPLRVNT